MADWFGRPVTLIITVLGYSVITALTGLAWNVASWLAWHALAGLFIGGEFVSYAYVMESVPNSRRGTLGGFLDTAYGAGFISATLSLAAGTRFTGNTWRYPFFFGIIPALLARWIRLGVDEKAIPGWRWPDLVRRCPIALGRHFQPALSATPAAFLGHQGSINLVLYRPDPTVPTPLGMLHFPKTQIGSLITAWRSAPRSGAGSRKKPAAGEH